MPCPALPCKLRVATGQGLLSQAATLHALVKPPFPLRLLRNDGQPWNVQRPDAIIIRARPPTSLQLDILFHQSTPSSDQHTLRTINCFCLKPQASSLLSQPLSQTNNHQKHKCSTVLRHQHNSLVYCSLSTTNTITTTTFAMAAVNNMSSLEQRPSQLPPCPGPPPSRPLPPLPKSG